jgi:hypothetical protein
MGSRREKKAVATPKRRDGRTVGGAVNLRPEKGDGKQAKKGTSAELIPFVHQLQRAVSQKLLVGLLEKASLQVSQQVAAFVAQAVGLLTPVSVVFSRIEPD